MTMYTLTLTTTTTRRWMVLSTLITLAFMVVHYHTPIPTWGGIHTLSYLGMVIFALDTVCWGLTCSYVRKHGPIVLFRNINQKGY